MARSNQKQAERMLKKLHPLTKLICLLALVGGIGLGAGFCVFAYSDDHFELKGQTEFSIDVGEEYTYREQGVDAVCFGRDISDRFRVKTDLVTNSKGEYIIPTDKEGVYTITYTVECMKFGEKAPNGVIKRVRVFTVSAAEEDGRNG